MKILVTGGDGYIGSHAIVALLEAGHEVVVLDNLANGSPEAVTRAAALGGGNVPFIEGDVRDRVLLDELFAEHACRPQKGSDTNGTYLSANVLI